MRPFLGALILLTISVLLRFSFLSGGLKLLTPRGDEPAAFASTFPSAVPASYRRAPLAYLSSAPADSLQLLPGIGPVLAARIAQARGGKRLFTSWDDVLRVRGIGPEKIRRLRELARAR